MQTAFTSPVNIISHPQAPPPPPPVITPMCYNERTAFTQRVDTLPDPYVEVSKVLQRTVLNFNNPEKVVLAFYRQVKPIIQNGPQCGLVALSMASQLLCREEFTPEIVFSKAVDMKLTKLGEMFSAEGMADLSESLLQRPTQVLTDIKDQKQAILEHILKGWPVLMPYDSDKNFEPCCRKGHSAHWAVITGVCITVPCGVFLPDSNLHHPNEEVNLYHVGDGSKMLKYLDEAESIFVLAHQGKSKHLAAWELDVLLDSNLNLFEQGDKYKDADMVLPSGTDLSSLRNKTVLLSL